MATITSAGVGSGLDIEGLVTKLMDAEKAPLTALKDKQKAYEAQISAYGKLTSAIATFRNALTPLDRATDYKVFNAASSNASAASATTSISAAPGQYSVDVTRLAENHKKISGVTFADVDTTKVGTTNDYIEITQGAIGKQKTFRVYTGGQTLSQIQTAINTASDNTGVTASVVKGGTDASPSYSLVLSAKETGQNGFMSLTTHFDPFQLADQSSGAKTSWGGAKYYADAGTTKIGVAGDQLDLNGTMVDIGNKTLNEIKDAINLDTGTHGVTASVESGSSGYRLVLTSASALDINANKYVTTAPRSSVFGLTDINTSRDPGPASGNADYNNAAFNRYDLDAIFKVEGTTVIRGSNNVSDAITGLTFSLKAAGATTIDVTKDTSTVQTRLSAFVDAYNKFMDTLDTLNETDLKNDATLRSVVSAVRNRLNAKFESGDLSYLSQSGIGFELKTHTRTDGIDVKITRLKLDTDTLSGVLNTNFDDLASLLSDSSSGIVAQLDSTLNNFVKSDGLLEARTDGIQALITGLLGQEDRMQTRLNLVEAAYRKQFSAMDALVASMKATSNFLTQQLTTNNSSSNN